MCVCAIGLFIIWEKWDNKVVENGIVEFAIQRNILHSIVFKIGHLLSPVMWKLVLSNLR